MCRLSGKFDHVSVHETAIGTGAGYTSVRVLPLKRTRGWLAHPIDPRFSLKLRKTT